MKALLVLILVLPLFAHAQPYEPHVIWDRSGETDSSAYGYKILPLGDQNDDGSADWAVYAQGNGGGWHGTRRPYLEFYHGSLEPDTMPYFVYRADSINYEQNWYVFSIGDVNGDGYADWQVRLWLLTHPAYYTVLVFYGGPEEDMLPDVELALPLAGCYPMGDFNADGFDDQYWWTNEGVGRMYFGGNPIDSTADWTLTQPPPGLNTTVPYAIGDFNGDGASDFVCFNPNNYNVAIFLGGANPDTLPDYSWTLPDRAPLGGVRSLNGDAHDEIIFGTLGAEEVHYGGPTLSPDPNIVVNFSCTATGGLFVASAGDFNHDDYDDLLMWTPSCTDNMFGSLTLHLGHSWLYPNPTFVIDGSWPDGLIGIYTAVGLGDVNGDSIDDIAIGAWDDFAYLGWRGRCVIIAGDDSLIASADNSHPEIPVDLAVSIYPNPFNSETTIELQAPSTQRLTTLTIYNLLGEQVRREVLPPFSNSITYRFEANELPSGVYLAHVQAGNLQATRKLMLLK